jgi:hypothetical protein
MKTAALTALAVLAAALPASAQEYRRLQDLSADAGFRALSAAAASGRADAERAAARARALSAALAAMNDGPEAGGRITAELAALKTDVVFAAQAAPTTIATVDGRRVILLSDALPATPRVYAPLIAAEAAKGLYADMPECAERAYMRAATAARVFAELGGDFGALPKVDGDVVPAVQAAVAAWSTDAQSALEDAARASGLPTLADLASAAKDAKTSAALEDANRRFVAFLLDERDARREAGR